MRFNPPLLAVSLLFSLTTLNAEASLTSYTANGVNLVHAQNTGVDVTWTADANLLGKMEASNANFVNTIISTIVSINDTPNYYDTPTGSNSGHHTLTTADFDSIGRASWFGAQAFVGYLNSINYAGSTQWALPSAGANPQYGYNQTGGQFGELFYTELGGTAGSNIPNTATFTNEQAFPYWLGTEYASNPNNAWVFDTGSGYQRSYYKNYQLYAWAVSPGQVAAVPVPSAIWLMGSGLLGLVSLKRRGHAG